MIEKLTPPDPKERVSTYIYFCSLYFVTVGILYLWGYWSPFDVNILEYLDLADIIKATAFPIATAILATAVGAALGSGLVDRKMVLESDGLEPRFWRFVHRYMPVVTVVYLIGTGALLALGPVGKWHVLPALFAIPILVFARRLDLMASVIPHDGPRVVVIYVIGILPFLAFGRGTIAADKIKSGESFTYARSEIPGYIGGPLSDAKQLPRLIGRAGDRMFFFDPRVSSVIIFKPEAGKSVVVKTHSEPVQPLTLDRLKGMFTG